MNSLFALIFGGAPGPMELMVLAGIGILLFGNRLPSVMRSLGKSVVEFKKGINGVEDEVNKSAQSTNEQSKLPQE
ncbi:MAG: Sec-independent protein translocase subunit TatA/TatB [Thermoguttaceae bacterium]